MQILRYVLPAALVMLALAGPLSTATHGGYHYNGVLGGAYATPFLSSAHEFTTDLAAGQSIAIAVEWFDPSADLDLFVVPPGGSCAVLPSPDVSCLAGAATNAVGRVTCPAGSDGRTLLGASPETLTYTAGVPGTHTIVLAASAGDVIASGIAYVLTVDGASGAVQGPDTGNWIRADACRGV